MISVVVPVYNVEKYLQKCVASITNQTFQDLEIILVDDGSTDASGNICDELAKQDSRIKVVHRQNGGLAEARNTGLDICCGDYVAFVDSDDYIESTMCETLYDAMVRFEADIAICGVKSVNEKGRENHRNTTAPRQRILSNDDLWNVVFGRLNNSLCNKLYKKKLIGATRFSSGIIHGEDLLFNLSYLLHCKNGILLTNILYNYVVRAGSITRSSYNPKKKFEIYSKDVALEFIQEHRPSLVPVAQTYCFRARMNVLRSIFASDCERLCKQDVELYREYVCSNYAQVRNSLRFKEKVEFFLFNNYKRIYSLLTKTVYRKRK